MAKELALGSRDALLARLWSLAYSPLDPSLQMTYAEETKVFSEACVNPDTGQINFDVLESLLPRNWEEQLKNYSDELAELEKAQISPQNTELKPEQEFIASSFSEIAAQPTQSDNGVQSLNLVTELCENIESINSPVSDVAQSAESTVVSTERDIKSRRAFLLPTLIPEPKANPFLTLAEVHYHIQAQPMAKLLALNHKALSTDAYKAGIIEGRLAVTFGRIEELKRADKWGLRQRVKFRDPARFPTHWDHLLEEAKFVRAGINGARRHKLVICHTISQAILDHFATKKSLSGKSSKGGGSFEVNNPNLVTSKNEYQKTFDIADSNAPSILTLHSLNPVSQELVANGIPEMQSFDFSPVKEQFVNSQGSVPVSKFLAMPNLDDNWCRVAIEELKEPKPDPSKTTAEPAESLTAMPKLNFRTRADSEIRPPAPPSQKLMTSRVGSAWQPSDDQMLLQLVRDFRNNWSLIAEVMAHTAGSGVGAATGAAAGAGSLGYTSSVERRTPWQMFERWMQLANVEPKDLKGKYADAARHWLDASTKVPQALRKRQMPISIPPDTHLRGHKRLRWASMLEGIRKIKKKREVTPKPSNSGFLLRQRAEQTRPAKMPTPAELSRMKYERDKQIADQYMHQRAVTQTQGRTAHNTRVGGRSVAGVVVPNATTNMMRGARELVPNGGTSLASNLDTTIGDPASKGPPPSIAGLPMPASVAAAAVARQQQQKQMQQMQQQQVQQVQQPQLTAKGQQVSMSLNHAGVAGKSTRDNSGISIGPTSVPQLLPQQQARIQALQPSQANNGTAQQPQLQQAQMQQSQRAQTPQSQQLHQAQLLRQQQQMASRSANAQPGQQQTNAQSVGRQRPMIPFSREQIQELMAKIARNNPTWTQQEVQKLAIQNVRRYMQVQQTQDSQRRITPETGSSRASTLNRLSASPVMNAAAINSPQMDSPNPASSRTGSPSAMPQGQNYSQKMPSGVMRNNAHPQRQGSVPRSGGMPPHMSQTPRHSPAP